MNKVKRFIIQLLFVAVITVALGSLFSRLANYPIEESENVFSSAIYNHYNEQLKTFIQQHPLYAETQKPTTSYFNHELQALIAEIEKPLGSAQEQRARHEMVVYWIRELIVFPVEKELADKEQAARQLFHDIVRWCYLGADLTSPMAEFLYTYVTPPQEGELLAYLPPTQWTLRKNSDFYGVKQAALEEDLFLQGNLPSAIMTLPSSSTQLIRLGHPLKSPSRILGWQPTPTVAPEFLHFLHLQPSHLYVNLMKRKGLEGPLTQAIEQLEEQAPNLYVVTLDKNSPFYKQEEKGVPEVLDSQQFKNTFVSKMCDQKGNYFWSAHLEPAAWQNELHQIVNAVHANIFHRQPTLNRAERLDFIELTYLAILDHLVGQFQPASMNITCRHGMDRGPSLMVLWIWQKGVLSDQELATQLLAPPLILHNRSGYPTRMKRFISAAKRLAPTQDPFVLEKSPAVVLSEALR